MSIEKWPSGMPKFTDAQRLDFIEAHGVDYAGSNDSSAWIKNRTVVDEPEPGEVRQPFNLRRAIDFVMHLTAKEEQNA